MLDLFGQADEARIGEIAAGYAANRTEAGTDSERRFRDLLQALPAAIYTTDAEGCITFFNRACIDFAGRMPKIGEMWCVTWKLYLPDGTALPHDECPMAIALKQNRPVRDVEAVAERPDGSRICFMPYPTPLRDERGRLVGAVNMLVDITARKEAEQRMLLLTSEVDHRSNNLLAVAQAMLRLTKADTAEEFQTVFAGRLSALCQRAEAVLGFALDRRESEDHRRRRTPAVRKPGRRADQDRGRRRPPAAHAGPVDRSRAA